METAERELKAEPAPRTHAPRLVDAGSRALLTRQLATLLRSGLPLEESLQAVAEQTEKPRVQTNNLGRPRQGGRGSPAGRRA